ncbi:MAG: hypothetical protein JWO05_710 [Gemmatimonadetes bacterium]|nr:hypothetical protein [Gemmatimonadota bacterium]
MVAYVMVLRGVRVALFWIAVVVAVVALLDWLVRTRRISPFSAIARFMRSAVDPLIAPVERTIVRAGGMPASAPWWALVFVVVGGLCLIGILDFTGGLVAQLAYGTSSGGAMLRVLLSWAFGLVRLALMVRVLSSWVNVSQYSRWIRWTFPLTEWILGPLRQFVPLMGMIDITPLIAFFLIGLLQGVIIRMIPA